LGGGQGPSGGAAPRPGAHHRREQQTSPLR
jgi:hypothetical protein